LLASIKIAPSAFDESISSTKLLPLSLGNDVDG
jgi:hypothetical protein